MALKEPLLYAELLPHLRQVSVVVALHSPSNATTVTKLSADGWQLLISHDGVTKTLYLPGQVVVSELFPPSVTSKELSWRFPLAHQSIRVETDTQLDKAPWSARCMTENVELSCRKCTTVIVKGGSIKTWKDLPSEGWAEMMDLWYCHKPTTDVGKDDSLTSGRAKAGYSDSCEASKSAIHKGYGASTSFSAQEGTGFINTTSFHIARADCSNTILDVTTENSLHYRITRCSTCDAYLGLQDSEVQESKLYKWTLIRCTTGPTQEATHPPRQVSMSAVIAARLSSIQHLLSVSKVLLRGVTSPSSPSSTQPSSTQFTSHNPSTQSLETRASVDNVSLDAQKPGEHSSPHLRDTLGDAGATTYATPKLISKQLIPEISDMTKNLTPENHTPSFSTCHPSSPSSAPAIILWSFSDTTVSLSANTIYNTGIAMNKTCSKDEGRTLPVGNISHVTRETRHAVKEERDSHEVKKHLHNSETQKGRKIFYKKPANDELDSLVGSLAVEEIFLPVEAITEMAKVLENTTAGLPPSTRNFQEWSIGFLAHCEDV